MKVKITFKVYIIWPFYRIILRICEIFYLGLSFRDPRNNFWYLIQSWMFLWNTIMSQLSLYGSTDKRIADCVWSRDLISGLYTYRALHVYFQNMTHVEMERKTYTYISFQNNQTWTWPSTTLCYQTKWREMKQYILWKLI